MISQSKLLFVNNLLSKKLPNIKGVIKSKSDADEWLLAIESLESRLILGNELSLSCWIKSSKSAVRMVDKTITLNDIKQSSIMIDAEIIRMISSKNVSVLNFDFRGLLIKLIYLKSRLISEPVFKSLFSRVIVNIKNKTPLDFLKVSVINMTPKQSKSWYKYYLMYTYLLGVINFNDTLKSSIFFKQEWWCDGDMFLLLSAYGLRCERDYFLKVIAKKSIFFMTSEMSPIVNAIYLKFNQVN